MKLQKWENSLLLFQHTVSGPPQTPRRTHGCAETASFLVCPGPAPDGSCLKLQVSPIRVTGFWCFVVASNRVTSRNIRTQRRGVKTLKLAGNSITKIFMFNVFQHLKKRLKQSFQWFGNHEIKYLNIWIYFGKHTDRWTHVKIPFINYKQNVFFWREISTDVWSESGEYVIDSRTGKLSISQREDLTLVAKSYSREVWILCYAMHTGLRFEASLTYGYGIKVWKRTMENEVV